MREENHLYAPVTIRHILSRQFPQLLGALFILLIVALASAYALNWPPDTFPAHTSFVVEEGLSVGGIGETLKEAGYIRSAFFFKLVVRSSYGGISLQAGEYGFEDPVTTLGVIELLRRGPERQGDLSFTFPEGFSLHDMHLYTKGKFDAIDFEPFIEYEGYLFPDTYFVAEREEAPELIARMRKEYEEKIQPFRARIEASPYSENEVIILASILEREANDEESMRLVSGILQDRLAEEHPLQVDATFEYILGKKSSELTTEDLEMDSPYNTYTNVGLPPTPIANPGRMAIEAVLSPTQSPYFYYLTGDDGTFHYARTFEEHKYNKERYIR